MVIKLTGFAFYCYTGIFSALLFKVMSGLDILVLKNTHVKPIGVFNEVTALMSSY